MPNINIHNADVIEWLKNYNDPKFHSVISDPPYGLAFMGKTWDKFTHKQYQDWCSEWSSLLLNHLYPGTVCMFFGGTRTYHRLATGLEDAGFEIFDSMMWITGQGFPKATNVGKKLGGVWNGYLTSLKPAFEPIVLCRKPRGKETFVDCALNYGTGALNVDGTRIETNDNLNGGGYSKNYQTSSFLKYGGKLEYEQPIGRFPANLGLICDCECEPCECNYQTIGDSARFFYTAKSSRKERNLGLDHLPTVLAGGMSARQDGSLDGHVVYAKNNHPTVKPIKLIEYLATMLKPPIENSSILIPFSGSGSEIIGAMFAGWNIINAIEIDENYCNIAKSRVDYWKQFSTYTDGLKGK